MEVKMGKREEEQIVFNFRSDERGISAEMHVYKVREGKREHIAVVTVGDIRNLARIFE